MVNQLIVRPISTEVIAAVFLQFIAQNMKLHRVVFYTSNKVFAYEMCCLHGEMLVTFSDQLVPRLQNQAVKVYYGVIPAQYTHLHKSTNGLSEDQRRVNTHRNAFGGRSMQKKTRFQPLCVTSSASNLH